MELLDGHRDASQVLMAGQYAVLEIDHRKAKAWNMQLLTAEEVAHRCRMPVEWVETAVSSGKIPAPICLDGHKRWRERDIDKWVEMGCPPIRASEEPYSETLTADGDLDLRSVEKKAIEKALRISNGNREEVARLLGIGERTVYRKLREYGLG